MTTSTTRRAILAGAASVPALAIVGPAVDAAPANDPIFAAIEAHRAARELFDSASLAADRAQGKFRDENGHFHPNALSPDLRKELASADPRFERCTLVSHKQIKALRWAPADVKAGLHRELDRQMVLHAETVEPLETASDAAAQIEHETRWAIAKTVPTTMAGIAAVLRYMRECEVQENYELFDSVSGDGGSRAVFQHSLERATCTLAGLPLPPEPAPAADEA